MAPTKYGKVADAASGSAHNRTSCGDAIEKRELLWLAPKG
jgi:hypothetical protein